MELKKLNILIVDDSQTFRKVLKETLENTSKFLCAECESGEEALAIIKTQKYDIIILDYLLTGITGLDVLKEMKVKNIVIPVLMLTAQGSQDFAIEAMKLGAYDYIRKEYIDLNHLPIILHNIYELYLFKKQREKFDKINFNLKNYGTILQNYKSSLLSYRLTVMNSLILLKSHLDEIEKLTRHNNTTLKLPETIDETKRILSIMEASLNFILTNVDDIFERNSELIPLEGMHTEFN